MRLATGNLHKLREVRQIFGPGYRILGLDDGRAWPEIEETGLTFAENAALKAAGISRLVPELVLADDSGLEVDALGGEPGVRSARFAGQHGDTEANNRLLLQRLEQVRGPARSARFRCVMAVARAGEVLATFDGMVEGVITPVPRGVGGFGYDPLFVPDGQGQTFAELGEEIKNGLSHRARALAGVVEWLRTGGLSIN